MAREIDDAWIEEAVERYRRIDGLRADFDAAVRSVEVTVRSPDGLVEVVVAADGNIRNVMITQPLAGRASREVSASVQSAVTAAADAAAWARRKLHEETFGAYPPLGS